MLNLYAALAFLILVLAGLLALALASVVKRRKRGDDDRDVQI